MSWECSLYPHRVVSFQVEATAVRHGISTRNSQASHQSPPTGSVLDRSGNMYRSSIEDQNPLETLRSPARAVCVVEATSSFNVQEQRETHRRGMARSRWLEVLLRGLLECFPIGLLVLSLRWEQSLTQADASIFGGEIWKRRWDFLVELGRRQQHLPETINKVNELARNGVFAKGHSWWRFRRNFVR